MFAIGTTVVAGWLFGTPGLARLYPSGPVIKFNTGLGLMLLASVICLLPPYGDGPKHARSRRLLAFCGSLFVAVLGLATLAEFILGRNLGLDQAIVTDLWSPAHSLPPGRMSVYSAISFSLCAISLLLQSRPSHWRFQAALLGTTGTVVLAIGLLSFGVRFENNPDGYQWWGPTAMGTNTAVPFCLLGAALIIYSVAEAKMHWALGPGPTFAFGGSLVVLLLLNAIVHNAASLMLAASRWSKEAQEVQLESNRVMIGMQRMAVAQRTYVLKNTQASLDDLASGEAIANASLSRLIVLTGNDQAQRQHVDMLMKLFASYDESAHTVISTFRKSGSDAAIALLSNGEARARAQILRKLEQDINDQEARESDTREAEATRIYERNFLILPIGTFFSLLTLSFVLFALNKQTAERRTVEGYLGRSEERFKTTFESLIEGCQIISHDWRYLAVNEVAARHGGKAPSDLVGRTMEEVYPGIEQTEMFRVLLRCMTSREPAHMENPFVYPDGSTTWFQLVVQPVPEGLFVLSLDITERIRAAEEIRLMNLELERRVAQRTAELALANKELEAFSYSVSHDLRAPLRGIDGFARILSEDYGEKLDAEGQRVLATINHETKRMGDLIDDLLRFSKISRLELRFGPVDMKGLAQAVFDEQSAVLETGSATLELADLPEVAADLAMIRQVWVNLIGNALKFSARRARPLVKVWSETSDGMVVFNIRDNGVGFDDRYKAKLFQVFQRLHAESEFEGTGVGLALVHRIITRHGGRVWAESKPDEGAQFSFSLPSRPQSA